MNGICHKVQKFKGLSNSNKNFLQFILKIPLYRIVMEGVDKKKAKKCTVMFFCKSWNWKGQHCSCRIHNRCIPNPNGFFPGILLWKCKGNFVPHPTLKICRNANDPHNIPGVDPSPPPLEMAADKYIICHFAAENLLNTIRSVVVGMLSTNTLHHLITFVLNLIHIRFWLRRITKL